MWFMQTGLHPVFCNKHHTNDLVLLEKKLHEDKPVAIGECGLDGFINNTSLAVQKNYFSVQLELSKQFGLPAIIHARDAVEEVILLLRQHALDNRNGNGVIHSYNGSLQQAHRLIDLGYLLSFGGPVSYTRSHKVHNLVKKLPLESMMLETDAPDQPTLKNRGNRNEPAYINEVIQRFNRHRVYYPFRRAAVKSGKIAKTTEHTTRIDIWPDKNIWLLSSLFL